MANPTQGMDPHKTRVEWREDLVNNDGVPIKVAPKNLRKKSNECNAPATAAMNSQRPSLNHQFKSMGKDSQNLQRYSLTRASVCFTSCTSS